MNVKYNFYKLLAVRKKTIQEKSNDILRKNVRFEEKRTEF